MKHSILKLIALTLVLCMILPMALSSCASIFGDDSNPSDASDAANNASNGTSDKKTNKKTKTTEAGVAIDMTAAWEDFYGENTLVQGCLVVNRQFAAEHPNEVAKFLEDYSASVNTIKAGDENAINQIVTAGILPKAAIAQKALPNCNICYFAGNDMKPVMNTFCEKIMAVDAKSIGGKLPADDFYYTANGNAAAADGSLEIKVYALNGTTALGMAKMINDANAGTDTMNYNISLHADATAIVGAIQNGECKIAALPTNVAAKLFNGQGKIQLLALNTLGVLYLLQGEGYTAVESLDDLTGKTVYVPGAGANPEYITAALLQAAGLVIGSDVTIDTTTYSSPDALATAFATGAIELAVLPEPKVTVALSQANAQ